MTKRTPAEIGAANRRKGAKAERDVAVWPAAPRLQRRACRAYRVQDPARSAADPGDLHGLEDVVISVKDPYTASGTAHVAWLDELDAMAGPPGAFRILIHKRPGHAVPDRWWCWLRQETLLRLLHHRRRSLPAPGPTDGSGAHGAGPRDGHLPSPATRPEEKSYYPRHHDRDRARCRPQLPPSPGFRSSSPSRACAS